MDGGGMKDDVGFNEVFFDCTKYGKKIPKENYLVTGKYPIVDQGQTIIAGYTDDPEGIFNDIPAIVFGDHTRVIKYVDKPFFLGADGVKLLKSNRSDVWYKYLFYALTAAHIPNTGYNRHFKWLKELIIPIPSLEKQQEITTILDKVTELIAMRTQQLSELNLMVKSRFIEMFGNPASNPMGWDKRPLAEYITYANNGIARRGNDKNGSIVLRLVELQSGFIDYSQPNRIILTVAEQSRYLLKHNDFLFARVNGNPSYVGRSSVFHDIGVPVYHNDHIIRVHLSEADLNGVFVSNLLNSDYGIQEMKSKIKTSAGQYTISQDGISAILVISPPLPLQNEFAAFVQQVDKSKFEIQKGLKQMEIQYNALMQQYFG
ncbi:restriction endonuclease subunit S [Treponema primitia]|uniref:restriction endonuclease subunit S n=1 Tax=Treponema primitia TaxID=88058 RepID=UPI00397F78B7